LSAYPLQIRCRNRIPTSPWARCGLRTGMRTKADPLPSNPPLDRSPGCLQVLGYPSFKRGTASKGLLRSERTHQQAVGSVGGVDIWTYPESAPETFASGLVSDNPPGLHCADSAPLGAPVQAREPSFPDHAGRSGCTVVAGHFDKLDQLDYKPGAGCRFRAFAGRLGRCPVGLLGVHLDQLQDVGQAPSELAPLLALLDHSPDGARASPRLFRLRAAPLDVVPEAKLHGRFTRGRVHSGSSSWKVIGICLLVPFFLFVPSF